MAYQAKANQAVTASTLQVGDVAPEAFGTQVVVNFVSPGCPYCQQQLPIFDAVAAKEGSNRYRFINVSPALVPDFIQLSPHSEWIADTQGKYREQFQVLGYPTSFVIAQDGKITQIIPGVPDNLPDLLQKTL